jgi:hypothetical protein
VSVDSGATWHPADGRETWSFTFTPNVGSRPVALCRAVDDSGNLTGAVPPSAPGLPTRPGPVVPGKPSPSEPKAPGKVVDPWKQPTSAPTSSQSVVPRHPVRVHVMRHGVVVLRVACPWPDRPCRLTLTLVLGQRHIATRALSVRAGTRRAFALKLTPSARRTLVRRGSLAVVLRATARDAAGHRRSAKLPLQILRAVTPSGRT